MQFVYEIKKEDINKRIIKLSCPTCHHAENIYVYDFMGYIMPCDIGKRIYKYGSGIYAIENDEQLNKRKNNFMQR